LITVALSTTIGARAEDVWRALTDPSERMAWDERILGEVSLSAPARKRDVPSSSSDSESAPSSGSSPARKRLPRRLRWRFRFGSIPMVMRDDVLSSDPHKRRVSRISIGSMQFDQTLTLYSEDDETGPHTRLGIKLVARNSIAVIGQVIPRLDVQRIVIEYVDTTLRQIQKYCER